MVKQQCLKKSTAWLLAFIVAMQCAFSAFAAVSDAKTKKIVRVSAALPEISVETSAAVDAEAVQAYLGGESEALERISVTKADDAASLTCFVIDNSTSMADPADTPRGLFAAAKEEIGSLVEKYADGDHTFTAYSFGKDNLKNLGEASDAKSAKTLAAAVDALDADEEGTSLNDALVDVFEDMADKSGAYASLRVVLVTDQRGDFGNGSSANKVSATYQFREIPLYGIVLTDASNSDVVKSINDICDSSGGYAEIVSEPGDADAIPAMYKSAQSNSIITFATDLTKSAGIQRLSIKDSEGNNIDAADVRLDSIKDISGAVNATVTDYNTGAITVYFDRPVSGGDVLGNYKVIYNGRKEITPDSVTQIKKSSTYMLNFDEKLYSGEYTIRFYNIADANGNQASETVQTLQHLKNPILKAVPYAAVVLFIGLVILAFYLVLLHLKKKKNVTRIKELFETQVQETVEEKYEVRNIQAPPKGVPVRLIMQTGNFAVNKVNINVDRSFIFGRSNTCDVFTDDRKLSRQHFAVENIGGTFMIQDLNTTNGTYLNGVRVIGRQKLHSGDVIKAGLTIIKIEF